MRSSGFLLRFGSDILNKNRGDDQQNRQDGESADDRDDGHDTTAASTSATE
jgi:hypothetical protein